MKEMFNMLGTLRMIYVKNKKILRPITAEQKKILKLFNCPIPDSSLNFNDYE
jgi:hypothetical protein